MGIKEKIENWAKETLGVPGVVLVHPKELEKGDFALIMNGPEAEKDFEKLNANKISEVERVEFVPPRFINIFLSKQFFAESVNEANEQGEKFGENNLLKGQKIIIEHTQPNPFKEFHIGHLMNNAVGESVARILKASGAETSVVSYHGDVGLHVAKAIWAKMRKPELSWGEAYAYGSSEYEENKEDIGEINKKIYDKSDDGINKLYEEGKLDSFNFFKSMYARLDSSFTDHFLESISGERGKQVVLQNVDKIFEKSEGAVVFKGENFEPKTHTRVFLNKDGLPTYEAKEVGLAKMKLEKFGNYNKSITITASEQDSFFKVVEVAIGEVLPELKGKLLHLSHGMLKLSSGKMSSRTGNVITAEELIKQVSERVKAKINASKHVELRVKISDMDMGEEKMIEQVAIGAIKYSILRQAIGGDIIFDFEKSISFEGDSGPYLQYTAVRASSVLLKARAESRIKNYELGNKRPEGFEIQEVEKLLYRFPEVVERAAKEYAPHHLVTYLTELASSFNGFYGNEKIIDPSILLGTGESDPSSPYKIALTEAVAHVLKNGLGLLGIKVPKRM